MPSKTLIASAAKPAGPVTLTSSPPPGSLTRSRMSSIGSRIVAPSPSPGDVADQQRRVAGLRRPRLGERRHRAVDVVLVLLDRPVELARGRRRSSPGPRASARPRGGRRSRSAPARRPAAPRRSRAPRSTRRRWAGSSSTRCSPRRCTCPAGSRATETNMTTRQTARTIHFARRPEGKVRKRDTAGSSSRERGTAHLYRRYERRARGDGRTKVSGAAATSSRRASSCPAARSAARAWATWARGSSTCSRARSWPAG